VLREEAAAAPSSASILQARLERIALVVEDKRFLDWARRKGFRTVLVRPGWYIAESIKHRRRPKSPGLFFTPRP
jgi:hypothetical protein